MVDSMLILSVPIGADSLFEVFMCSVLVKVLGFLPLLVPCFIDSATEITEWSPAVRG